VRPPRRLRLWFNESYRGSYQLIGFLRDNPDRVTVEVLGSHRMDSTPFLQACDRVVPEPGGAAGDFVEAALARCRRDGVDVFVPGRHAAAVAQHRALFEAAGTRVMVSPAAAMRTLSAKATMYAGAAGFGLRVPRHVLVRTVAGFRAACDELADAGLRVCFKPDRDHGGRGFRLLDEAAGRTRALYEEPAWRIARRHAEELLAQVPEFPPIVVSEYLDGPELSIDCLADDGRLLVALPRSKSGPSWTRRLVPDGAAVQIARATAGGFRLGYLINVQVRYAGDEAVFLEVNPRASSGLYQSCRMGGVNLPYAALRLLVTGDPGRLPAPQFGAAAIVYNESMPFRSPRTGDFAAEHAAAAS
jgi:biotin carboxylase